VGESIARTGAFTSPDIGEKVTTQAALGTTCDGDPKAALRAALLAARTRFVTGGATQDSGAANARIAARLTAKLDELAARATIRCVGFYWPVAGEFDAREVIANWLHRDTARCAALPVVVAPRAAMAFHAWMPDTPMQQGRYRIPVPADGRAVVPDVLLVPCVGFDSARYRLGYGGGYYDRTLAAWPTQAPRPIAIGVAYQCGHVEALVHEAHDIPLDAVITENGLY
jgi:5,10-methenyltetrahydrofolate synthetase